MGCFGVLACLFELGPFYSGQNDLGQLDFDTGQKNFSQRFVRFGPKSPHPLSQPSHLPWCKHSSCKGGARRVGPRRVEGLCVCVCCVCVSPVCLLCVSGPRFVCSPRTPLPRTSLLRTALPPDRPKFRFFFPSPATIFIHSSLSGGLLVEFWWCF